jgi:TctA family transporter
VLHSAAEALASLFTLQHIAFLTLGVILGLLLGALPGIGGVGGLALLLPFTYTLETSSALSMMIGLLAVAASTDVIPAVLFGVPGSAGVQATIMDGYAMAKRGEAGRALGAAYAASLLGGLIGAVILAISLPVVRPIVLNVGSPQLFMITILGIAMVGIISSGAPIKGLLAGGLGLCLGLIGTDPRTATLRWTFGDLYLFNGLPVIPVFLGMFGLPEISNLLAKGLKISQVPAGSTKGVWTGVRDVFRSWFLVLRTAIGGAAIGAVPGIGKSVGDWLAYGHAFVTEKGAKHTFGKGDVRGVIAPESTNNAIDGGALIPTLVFGVPANPAMVLILGAMTIQGIVPGPSMLQSHLDITYTLLWSLIVAHFIGVIICVAVTPQIAKVATMRINLLTPAVVCLMFMGAFTTLQDFADLIALCVMGVVGYFMKRYGWPRPALVLGFVLSTASEKYFFISHDTFGWTWLSRPSVIILFIIGVAILVYGFRQGRAAAKVPGRTAAGNGGVVGWARTRLLRQSRREASEAVGQTPVLAGGGAGPAATTALAVDTGPPEPVPEPATLEAGDAPPEPESKAPVDWGAVGLAGLALVVFGTGWYLSRDWPNAARLFPWFVCVPCTFLAAAQLLLELFRPSRQIKRGMDLAPDEEDLQRNRGLKDLTSYLWILLPLPLIYVCGLYIAFPVYCALFLVVRSREKLVLSTVYTAVVGVGMWLIFDRLLGIPDLPSAVQGWFGYGA